MTRPKTKAQSPDYATMKQIVSAYEQEQTRARREKDGRLTEPAVFRLNGELVAILGSGLSSRPGKSIFCPENGDCECPAEICFPKHARKGDSLKLSPGDRAPSSERWERLSGKDAATAVTLNRLGSLRAVRAPVLKIHEKLARIAVDLETARGVARAAAERAQQLEAEQSAISQQLDVAQSQVEKFFEGCDDELKRKLIELTDQPLNPPPAAPGNESPLAYFGPRGENDPRHYKWNSKTMQMELVR